MKFHQFLEVFGQFNYELPEDKEQQLYDFYMLGLLRNRSSFQLHHKIERRTKSLGFNPDKEPYSPAYLPPTTKVGEFSHEDKIDYVLDEVSNKLLIPLKNNLLDAVFFSICAEIRHVLNYGVAGQHVERLEPQEKELFKNYAKNYHLFNTSNFHTFFNRDVKFKEKDFVFNSSESYLNSYKAFLKSGASKSSFVSVCKKLFSKDFWASSYGGKPWENIAIAWIDLNNAKKPDQLMTQIDHVYDLQHNTDTVFNKIRSYTKSGNFLWIKNALDHKARIKSPYEIMDRVSPAMKKIAQRAIWVKYGISQEEFNKEKEEYKKKQSFSDEEIADFDKKILGDLDPLDNDLWDDNYALKKKKTIEWKVSDDGLERTDTNSGAKEFKFKGEFISSSKFSQKIIEANHFFVKNINEKIAQIRPYFTDQYKVLVKVIGYSNDDNGNFDISNLLGQYDSLYNHTKFYNQIFGSIFELQAIIPGGWVEKAIWNYVAKRLGIEFNEQKINKEIADEKNIINFFTNWDNANCINLIRGNDSPAVVQGAKAEITQASKINLGVNKKFLDYASQTFKEKPDSIVPTVKFVRDAARYRLVVSKKIGEFLMAYELLTDPNYETINKIKRKNLKYSATPIVNYQNIKQNLIHKDKKLPFKSDFNS